MEATDEIYPSNSNVHQFHINENHLSNSSMESSSDVVNESNTNENHASSSEFQPLNYSDVTQQTGEGSKVFIRVMRESWIPDVPDSVKPALGLTFDTLDKGIAFYANYALLSGFDYRKSTSQFLSDGNVKLKYLLCSKEGFKVSKPYDGLIDKRPCKSETRTGCDARVKFRRLANGTYFLYFFEEKHNHELVSAADNHLLKSRRHLDFIQKSFIVNLSNANVGASAAHKIMKEITGGYETVGGTIVDYKNFNKELNCFIGESDAQMVVDKLDMKVEDVPDYSFQFKCGDDHRLTGLFWADAKAKQNYKAYGDVISFDATYDTNKYSMVFVPFTGVDKHKRCITFGAGLLASETAESYSWLLSAFLESFDKKEPTLVVTDQDPAMRRAIADVFPHSKHRLCMWHVMKKLKDKVPSSIFNDTSFCEQFNPIVWNANTNPADFEEKWLSILEEYKLENNKWLCDMFEIRDRWIPAYFRDLPMSGLMRTTSRSESENYFFGRFSHPNSMLVSFLSRFESAMDKQRNTQHSLDYSTRTSEPVFRTPRKIERHAAKLYTRTVFFEVQNEIYESVVSCSQISFNIEDGSKKRIIEERDEKMEIKGQYKVVSDETDSRMECRCRMFVRHGLLCRHMFCALWLSGVHEIPNEYILKRWTRDAEETEFIDANKECAQENCLTLVQDVYSTVRYSLSRLSNNTETLGKYRDQLLQLKNEIEANLPEEPIPTAKETMASLLHVSQPSVIKVLVPEGIRTKGCGRRMISDRDKAIAKSLKPKRKCRLCGEYTTHDSRNCPLKNKDK